MPTVHEKTWVSKANIALNMTDASTRNADFYFQVKKFLIGGYGNPGGTGAWTVAGSGNGVVGAMDSTDRWATAADVVIPPSSGSVRSWMVLRSPGTNPVYLHLIPTSGTTGSITCTASVTAPSFSGSMNADPTRPADTFGTTALTAWPTFVPAAITRLHLSLAHDGSFHILVGEAGRPTFRGHLFMHRFADARTDDICPWVLTNPSNWWSSNTAISGSFDSHTNTWLVARNPLNTLARNITLVTLGKATPAASSDYWSLFPGGYLDNDAAKGLWAIPIWVMDGTVHRGRLQDLLLGPGIFPTAHGQCEPNTTSPKSVLAGIWWVPMLEAPDMS